MANFEFRCSLVDSLGLTQVYITVWHRLRPLLRLLTNARDSGLLAWKE